MKRGNGVRYPGIRRRAEGNVLFRVEFNWPPGTRPRFEDVLARLRPHIFEARALSRVGKMRPRNEQTEQTSPTGRSNWLIKCHSRRWSASLSIFPREEGFFFPSISPRGETYSPFPSYRISDRWREIYK